MRHISREKADYKESQKKLLEAYMNKENLTAYEVVTEENLTDIHSTAGFCAIRKQVQELC